MKNNYFNKALLSSLIGLGAAFSAHAASNTHHLLIGTYTGGSSEGIYRYGFDSATGTFSKAPLQVVKSENPSWLTISRDKQFLYAVNENGPGQADVVGKVSSYSIDPKTHDLTLLNQVQSKGDEPTHSSLAGDGKFLFVANYAVQPDPGGILSVLPIDATGRLGEVVQQPGEQQPSKVVPDRQANSHIHSVVSSNDGRFVFTQDLGADKVYIYRYDPSNLTAPLTKASPSSISLPPGSGPRHLLFDKDGKHAYLTMEMQAQIAVFDYRAGRLVQTQMVAMTDSKEPAQNAGAALHLSKDGRFLYVSNRGAANELIVYEVNKTSGHLKMTQRRSVEGDHPREFTLDPSGKFLLVANQKSNNINVIVRDPQTGRLGKTVSTLKIDSPSDVKFLD